MSSHYVGQGFLKLWYAFQPKIRPEIRTPGLKIRGRFYQMNQVESASMRSFGPTTNVSKFHTLDWYNL